MQEVSEYAKIMIEHRVKKEMIESNKEKIEELEKTLKTEKEQLDKLREKQYKLQNNYCETVWNFSKKHDFGNFFVNYPRQRIPSPCNCEFFNETTEKIEKEIQENEDIQKLSNEIKSLELELKTFEEEIEKTENMNRKFSFDHDNEIERLTEILEKSQQELKFLQNEIMKHGQSEQVERKRDVERNSLKIMSKTTERVYEKPKKLKLDREISDKKQIPLENYPITINTNMNVKRKNNPSKEETNYQPKNEGIVKNYQSLKTLNQPESVILSSWTRNTVANDFSFSKAESSTSGTISEKMEINPMISEGKSKAFTPKRKSSIAEKFSKKLTDKLNKLTEL